MYRTNHAKKKVISKTILQTKKKKKDWKKEKNDKVKEDREQRDVQIRSCKEKRMEWLQK